MWYKYRKDMKFFQTQIGSCFHVAECRIYIKNDCIVGTSSPAKKHIIQKYVGIFDE